MRIFIGITEISGYYNQLQKGFIKCGVKADYYSFSVHPFGYNYKEPKSLFFPLVKKSNIRQEKIKDASVIKKYFYKAVSEATRLLFFFTVIFKYNIFLFGFGKTITIFPSIELKILKLLRKKIICVFHGSDNRPPFISGGHYHYKNGYGRLSKEKRIQRCHKITIKQKRKIEIIEKYADICITSIYHAHFHSKPFIKGLVIGLPFDSNLISNQKETNQYSKEVRILHAPSSPAQKGSEYIRKIIEQLKNKGLDIDYIEISDLTHKEVINNIINCDFIVDQVFSDTPMAGFTAEAAFFKKPAVVGGYVARETISQHYKEEVPPSIFVSPADMPEAIEKMIIDVPISYRSR